MPFRVEEGDRRLSLVLYGAEGDVDWIRYGPVERDSLVRRVDWSQEPGRVVRLDVELARPVWGYRTRWKRHRSDSGDPPPAARSIRAIRSTAG